MASSNCRYFVVMCTCRQPWPCRRYSVIPHRWHFFTYPLKDPSLLTKMKNVGSEDDAISIHDQMILNNSHFLPLPPWSESHTHTHTHKMTMKVEIWGENNQKTNNYILYKTFLRSVLSSGWCKKWSRSSNWQSKIKVDGRIECNLCFLHTKLPFAGNDACLDGSAVAVAAEASWFIHRRNSFPFLIIRIAHIIAWHSHTFFATPF